MEDAPIYVRMHGRQTYAYLAAHFLTGDEELLKYGRAGLKRLDEYENPCGGHYSVCNPSGEVDTTAAISIQDQCYAAFPLIMAYRISGEISYVERMWDFVRFIDEGPYRTADGSYVDALDCTLKTRRAFETETMNIVSVVDFANLILIPLLRITPENKLTDKRKALLVKWCDLLVSEFWGNGIFWNDRTNRTEWNAKHVDLGHTSKAYGILLKADRLLSAWGCEARYRKITEVYPLIVKAAADDKVGWLTDFKDSATTFERKNMSWWRHILVNQTVCHFAVDYPELNDLLEGGVRSWFECEFVDRTRSCRGIREGLDAQGHCISNDDAIACKANKWKNAYHEVEHVLTLSGRE